LPERKTGLEPATPTLALSENSGDGLGIFSLIFIYELYQIGIRNAYYTGSLNPKGERCPS